MSVLITVSWKHVLLDPLVFQAHGTYRVARVPGGVNAFPVPKGASGIWESENRHWAPALAGLARDHYDHGGRIFNFGFWSVKEFQNGYFNRGSSQQTNEFDVNYTSGIIRIEATAFYFWDFGDGRGPHAIFIDAFNDTTQEFIPDDFVDVIPDDEKGTMTANANNGSLGTDGIANAVVRARTPAGDTIYMQYQFNRWVNEQDLSRISSDTVPTIEGRDIRIRSGSVIAALAHYNQIQGSPVPRIDIPGEGGFIIGIPADGPFIFVPYGGTPQPVGPWDPTLFNAIISPAQIKQISMQVDDLKKRIEILEKLK